MPRRPGIYFTPAFRAASGSILFRLSPAAAPNMSLLSASSKAGTASFASGPIFPSATAALIGGFALFALLASYLG